MGGDDLAEGLEQAEQAGGEGRGVGRRHHPVGDMDQARTFADDHAPAGVPKAGVEAQNANRVRHVFPSIARPAHQGKPPSGLTLP